jgi:hypothetical protein
VLLTITTTHQPADELGYLLGKHPDRVHRAELGFGGATVVFPEVGSRRCTAALAATPIPLELAVPAVRDADELARRLFAPLGWAVEITPVGPVHVALRLTGTQRLADALSRLYVLLPVLDDSKHYPVGADEAAKLLRAGESWLAGHPERELISRRYLRYRRRLTVPTLAAERRLRLDELAPAARDRVRLLHFEWTRAEFAAWCAEVAGTHGYRVRLDGIGDPDPELGNPTQLAVFTRETS